ncbi:hypothetical protein ACTWPT_57965 [Nonomuraea sp. 3N208]
MAVRLQQVRPGGRVNGDGGAASGIKAFTPWARATASWLATWQA